MYKESGYDHREALFGIPSYGGSIAQNVYYASQSLCDEVNPRIGYPARDKDSSGKMAPWPTPFILLVDRGGCTFVTKVRNAQKSGASGVIIAENTCLCSDVQCVEVNNGDECQTSEPIMADDGSGSDITIPAFLMFKHDADLVKDEVMKGNIVQIEMQWALPRPDDRVEYDLWTTPTEFVSSYFLTEFLDVAKALGQQAYFTPHLFIFDGKTNGCAGAGVNQCYTLCTNNGRYCAMDPDGDLNLGASGADVVEESLRRICIWKHYGEEDGIGSQWWNYVNTFTTTCTTSTLFHDEKCVQSVLKKAKIDDKVIDQCIRDSGGLVADTTNAILEDEINDQVRRGVVILPSAYVNNVPIRGAINVNNVFGAICAGYSYGTEPKICKKCSSCANKYSCVTSGKCRGGTNSKSGGVSFHTFVLTLLLVGGGVAAFGAYNYYQSQRDMREQVRGILAEYMPLEDQEGSDGRDINPAVEIARQF